MSLFLAAVLIIGGLVGVAAVAIGIPVFFGMMAYDVVESRKKTTSVAVADAAEDTKAEDTRWRIAVERGVARAFVITGGAFWTVATFAGWYSFRQTGWPAALLAAFFPLVATAVTLIVGWYFERTTAALLLGASLAVLVWGVIYQWEAGVWMLMVAALIGPMLTAAVLFWMARRDQEAFETAWATHPQLALAFSARSGIAA